MSEPQSVGVTDAVEFIAAVAPLMATHGALTFSCELGTITLGGVRPQPEKPRPTQAQLDKYKADLATYHKARNEYEEALDFAHTEGMPDEPVPPEEP